MQRKTPLRRAAPDRAHELRAYTMIKAEYLRRHPYCQIFIARHGLDEAAVIAAGHGTPAHMIGPLHWRGVVIPPSTQIHHRNKRSRDRLNDVGWWLAACQEQHDHVEAQKDWARLEGFLLPINADRDGRMPAGCVQPLPTPAFMAARVTRA